MLKKGIIPNETFFPIKKYTNEEINHIISTLPKLSKKNNQFIVSELQRQRTIWEASEFFFRKPRPTLKQLKKENYKSYSEIQKLTVRLINKIEENKNILICDFAPLENRLKEKEKATGRLNQLIIDLTQLSNDLKPHIARLKNESKISADKSKNREKYSETYRKEFILALIKIYENITGMTASAPSKYDFKDHGKYKTKINGFFFRFFKACINPIKTTKDETIKTMIERVLKRKPLSK